MLAGGLVALEQTETTQKRAVTQAYGEAAYAAGVRIESRRALNTGAPADPEAVDRVQRRSFLPEFLAFFLTLITADWLKLRYYGAGYGDQPLVDLRPTGERLARWWRARTGRGP
jgi:hypothetical protein